MGHSPVFEGGDAAEQCIIPLTLPLSLAPDRVRGKGDIRPIKIQNTLTCAVRLLRTCFPGVREGADAHRRCKHATAIERGSLRRA